MSHPFCWWVLISVLTYPLSLRFDLDPGISPWVVAGRRIMLSPSCPMWNSNVNPRPPAALTTQPILGGLNVTTLSSMLAWTIGLCRVQCHWPIEPIAFGGGDAFHRTCSVFHIISAVFFYNFFFWGGGFYSVSCSMPSLNKWLAVRCATMIIFIQFINCPEPLR